MQAHRHRHKIRVQKIRRYGYYPFVEGILQNILCLADIFDNCFIIDVLSRYITESKIQRAFRRPYIVGCNLINMDSNVFYKLFVKFAPFLVGLRRDNSFEAGQRELCIDRHREFRHPYQGINHFAVFESILEFVTILWQDTGEKILQRPFTHLAPQLRRA